MLTNRQVYRHIKAELQKAGFIESEAEAREIICHFENCGYAELPKRFDNPAVFDVCDILSKRMSGMPLAYILGEKYFYGLSFYVDSRVLIPRFDTELITDIAINEIKAHSYSRILDMCCGSGCIGISIAKNTDSDVVLSDNSLGAIEVCSINRERHGAYNTEIIKSDLFSDIYGIFDIIVSNPPYVTEEEYKVLEKQVRDFEPKEALIGGLHFYKEISRAARNYLKPGGCLLFEIGYSQAADVSEILKRSGYENIRCEKDFSGYDRVIICTKN